QPRLHVPPEHAARIARSAVRLRPERPRGTGTGTHPAPGVAAGGALAGLALPIPGTRRAAGPDTRARGVQGVLGQCKEQQFCAAGSSPGPQKAQVEYYKILNLRIYT